MKASVPLVSRQGWAKPSIAASGLLVAGVARGILARAELRPP